MDVLGKKGEEELRDPEQGGSGAKGKDGELVLDVDTSLVMKMSAERKAVEKAMEVQEELDTVSLENEALKKELRANKELLDKKSEREELMARRVELEKKISRVGHWEDEWALRGGERRETLEGGSVDRSRSRTRGSRAKSTGSRRGSLPRLPEGCKARRLSLRSRSSSRSPRKRVMIRSLGRGTKRRTLPGISSPRRPRRPPRRSPPRRTLSGRTSPRTSPGRRSSRRARSRERGEQDLSTRRLSGEIAILKRQVELQEKKRKPW